jgi:hypothetical protein
MIRQRGNWSFGRSAPSHEYGAEPNANALRQRRTRERRMLGLMVVAVTLGRDEIGRLVERCLLNPDDAGNRQAIAEALRKLC